MVNLEATFTMNSAQAEAAIKRVVIGTDKLANAGKQAEQSVRSLNTSFGNTSRGASQLNLSAEKTGIGIKNLVLGVLDSKQPIMELANSMSYLTRAFKVGVAGTAGVIAIAEVIKGLTKENAKLDEITKGLNESFKGFSKTMTTLSLDGAISQISSLGDAMDKAFEKMEEPGFLERISQGISDIFTGAAKRRTAEALVQVAGGVETSKAIAEQQLARKVEISLLARSNKLEADRLAVIDEYNVKKKEAIRLGQGENYLSLLQLEYDLKLLDINKKIGEEAERASKAKQDAAKASFDEALRAAREEQKALESNSELFKKYSDEARKKNSEDIENKKKEEIEAQNAIRDASIRAAREIEMADQRVKQKRLEMANIISISPGGRIALESAKKEKERKDIEKAREDEIDYLKEQRALRGLEGMTLQDVRKRIAREAVGLEEPFNPKFENRIAESGFAAVGQQGATKGGLESFKQDQLSQNNLINSIQKLISTYQTAPLITSGAGSN